MGVKVCSRVSALLKTFAISTTLDVERSQRGQIFTNPLSSKAETLFRTNDGDARVLFR